MLTPLTSLSPFSLEQVLKVDHDKRDFGKEKLSGTLYYVHYKGWKASCVSKFRGSGLQQTPAPAFVRGASC